MLGYALDYGDTELLSRLTSPEDVAYQIGMRNFLPPGLITRQMRLSLAAAWSPRCDKRLGAGIFCKASVLRDRSGVLKMRRTSQAEANLIPEIARKARRRSG